MRNKFIIKSIVQASVLDGELKTVLTQHHLFSYFAFCLDIWNTLYVTLHCSVSSLSSTSQLLLFAVMTHASSHLFPPHTASRFQLTAGNSVPRSEVYSSHYPSLSLFYPMKFFTPFLLSVLRGSFFFLILTSQPVNLRSLDGHLSTPEHQGV